MEINEFREAATKANFLGKKLEKINVSIDSWVYTPNAVCPMHNKPRYSVRYYYPGNLTGHMHCISGTGTCAHAAILSAFSQWLEEGLLLDPEPTTMAQVTHHLLKKQA